MKADKKAGLAAPWGVAAQTGGEKRVAKTLAKQLAAGDPEAFAALYDRLAVIPPSAVQLAGGLPRDTAIPRHRDTLHVLDTRSFLQGDL